MIFQGSDAHKASRGVTTGLAPATPNLLQIGLARTPGSYAAANAFSINERRLCAIVLGSEDLRVFTANHKPPIVFDLRSTEVQQHCTNGILGLHIQRRGVLRRVLFPLCCCEPVVHLFKFPRTEHAAATSFVQQVALVSRDADGVARSEDRHELEGIPNRESLRHSHSFFLHDLPDNAFHSLAAFLHACSVHEMMRANSVLRSRFVEEQFWYGAYVNHVPKGIREQIDEFDDMQDKPYMDKLSVAHLRFCNRCSARRADTASCSCGADCEFHCFVRFDLRSYELRRLGLYELSSNLLTYGFDLNTADLCYSTRYHGVSLQQMMLRASKGDRGSHLLVCECVDCQIFGAYLGFPLRRLAPKAYGSSACFLFDLGSLSQPRLRIFPYPKTACLPAKSAVGQFSLCMHEQVVIGLMDDLREATCEPSSWCDDMSISHRKAPLRSVSVFSPAKRHSTRSGRLAYHLQDGGSQAEAGSQIDNLLLDLVCTSYLKDYFV